MARLPPPILTAHHRWHIFLPTQPDDVRNKSLASQCRTNPILHILPTYPCSSRRLRRCIPLPRCCLLSHSGGLSRRCTLLSGPHPAVPGRHIPVHRPAAAAAPVDSNQPLDRPTARRWRRCAPPTRAPEHRSPRSIGGRPLPSLLRLSFLHSFPARLSRAVLFHTECTFPLAASTSRTT